MKPFITLLFLLATGTVRAGDDDWKLVWSDEFDVPGSPRSERWSPETGFIRNGESQYYTRDRMENARVENGLLVIEARKEHWPISETSKKKGRGGRDHADYTSASLTTRGKAAWTYGRVEVRAKLPAGRGVWPAIWMLGSNIGEVGWPLCGELDIMEFVGYDPGVIHANIHTKKYNHAIDTGKGAHTDLPDTSKTFHIYAMEWDQDHIDFFVDQRKYFSFRKESGGREVWPFDKDQYLILNLAVGGGWGGRKGIDDTIFPQRYEIDYVRIYQKPVGGR